MLDKFYRILLLYVDIDINDLKGYRMKVGNTKRVGRFIAVFAVCMAFFAVLTYFYIGNKSQMERSQMEQLTTIKSVKVKDVITKLLYKTQTLSALVIQNDGDIKDFDRVAATLVDDPAIKNVILAPDGVVSDVYPLEGNENVVGLDYFSDGAGNSEAVLARQTEQLVLGGPFELVQGGQALVGRLPIFTQKDGERSFWGIVSVTLNYPQVLDGAELSMLERDGFAFEIWRISPETKEKQIIASSDYDYNQNTQYVEQPMDILNAEWYFKLSPIREWYEYPETWILMLLGLVTSWFVAFLFLHNYELKRVKAELEELTYMDPLTGVLNRRGIFKRICEYISAGQEFVLCYMDMNGFKEINDTHGHAAGDEILKKFAQIVDGRLGPKNVFGRIGGDEFVLVFKAPVDDAEVEKFFATLNKKLERCIKLDGEEAMSIYFSFGKAAFPGDAQNLDDLISFADGEMYKEKLKTKGEKQD